MFKLDYVFNDSVKFKLECIKFDRGRYCITVYTDTKALRRFDDTSVINNNHFKKIYKKRKKRNTDANVEDILA